MKDKTNHADVRAGRDGHVELSVHGVGTSLTIALTGAEITTLVAALLQGSVVGYRTTHDLQAPGFKWPLSGVYDVYAPIIWPITSALTAPALDEKRMAVGLAAAYGDAQVFVGLQRNQLKQFAEMMLEMDRRLPPSDTFELSIE